MKQVLKIEYNNGLYDNYALALRALENDQYNASMKLCVALSGQSVFKMSNQLMTNSLYKNLLKKLVELEELKTLETIYIQKGE